MTTNDAVSGIKPPPFLQIEPDKSTSWKKWIQQFEWWNASAGSRTIIMQLREAVDKKREAKLQLLYITPQRATILKCNEMVQELSLQPMMGLGFFPDLFTLNLSYGSVDARRVTFNMKYRLVETVFDMLQELKLSSYS